MENTACPSTITYFRTTLDPLDVYRLERIIDHGEDMGAPTPAAALAVYLRGIDPSLRWHRTGLELDDMTRSVVRGIGDLADEDASDVLYLDAAVFTHGTNHTIVMGLKPTYFPASNGPIDRTLRINRPSYGRHDCISWATTLPVADTVRYRAGFKDQPVPSSKSRDAAWLADFSGQVSYLNVQCYSEQLSLGGDERYMAVDAPAPEVAGFVPVSWDSPTWLVSNRPRPGHDLFMDCTNASSEDELTSIVSCIRQGGNNRPLVTIEVQQQQ